MIHIFQESELIKCAKKLVKKAKIEEIIDQFLDWKLKLEEIRLYCELAEECLVQQWEVIVEIRVYTSGRSERR